MIMVIAKKHVRIDRKNNNSTIVCFLSNLTGSTIIRKFMFIIAYTIVVFIR